MRFDKFHFLERAAGAKCLIVGDIILDRYLYGEVSRISPEAPIPVVKVTKKSDVLGGAANVAGNVRGYQVGAVLFGVIGNDINGQIVSRLLNEQGIEFKGSFSRQTTCKTRVVGMSQQMLRVDEEEDFDISFEEENYLLGEIKHSLGGVRSVVISDYRKGVCTSRLCSGVISAARLEGIPVIVDPKSEDWGKYAGANIITPNFREFCKATHTKIDNDETCITSCAKKIITEYGLGAVLVTRSEKGMLYVSDSGESFSFPATAREVFDVSGAGDTVVATVAAFLASGYGAKFAVEIANMSAGIVVGKLGTYAISLEKMASCLDLVNSKAEEKFVSHEELLSRVERWRGEGEKIVFTNGCFDILHAGHVYYLEKAREMGGKLIVGLNSDLSVKRLKGETRPINTQKNRALLLSAMEFVDAVILFDEDTPTELIKNVMPDVLVKGGDYKPHEVAGREFAGEVALIPFLDGFSSSAIIKEIMR